MKLLDFWLPGRLKSEQRESWGSTESTIDQKKRYGYFALSTVNDAFSFFYNISQHVVCLEQLEKLPQVILDIALYSKGHESIFLKETDKEYWGEELEKFNKKINSNKKKSENMRDNIEKLIHESNFVAYASSILSNIESSCISPSFSSDSKTRELFSLLIRLTPLIERRIFVTYINSPTPFYFASRQSLVFRLWFILWLYESIPNLRENYKSLLDSSLASVHSIEVGKCRFWKIQPIIAFKTNKKKSFLGIAGPYIQVDDSINNLYQAENELVEILSNFMSDKNFASISKQKTERLPSRDLFENALRQRIHFNKFENHRRIEELRIAWLTLQAIAIAEDAIEVSSLGVDELTTLATIICWVARYKEYPDLRTALSSNNYIPNASFGYYLSNSNIDSSFSYALIPVNEKIGLEIDQYGIELIRSKGKRPQVIEKIDKNERWVLTLTEIENRILSQRQNLHRNATEQMSHLLKFFSGISYFEKPYETCTSINIEVKKACNDICSLACRATGADSVQIYLLNHAESDNGNLLQTIGIFSRDPRWLNVKQITNELNKYKEKIGFNNKPVSFLIRSLKEKPILLNKLNNENSLHVTAYKPYKPKSGIAVPLIIHNRVLGVMHIKGSHEKQFSQRWMQFYIQTANIVSPFLYHLRLADALAQIQQLLSREIDFSTPDQETLNPVSKILCDVLLLDKTHIILRNNENFDTYSVKGHNFDPDFFHHADEPIPKFHINIPNKMIDKDSIFSMLPGISNGGHSIVIKKENRFDYLHCKYEPINDEMIIDLYSKGSSNSYKLSNYIKNKHKFIQKIYNRSAAGLCMSELILFPIVSPSNDKFDRNDTEEQPILGFVLANNKTYRTSGRNWKSIIQALSQAISIGISHSDYLFTTKSEQEKIVRHEIRAYTTQIERTIRTTQIQAKWLLRATKKNQHNEQSQRLDAVNSIHRNINSLHHNIIPELHEQLKSFKISPILQRLGIPVDIMPQIIDVTEQLRSQLATFNHKRIEKGLYYHVTPHTRIFAEINPIALRHILDNILSNIFKYTRNNSSFSILIDSNFNTIQFKNETICNNTPPHLYAEDLRKIGARSPLDRHREDGEGVGIYILETLSDLFLKSSFIYEVSDPFRQGKNLMQTHTVILDFSNISTT